MRRMSADDQNCSIARTLAVIGDRWTVLVVRELALGRRRFGDIRANVGLSTNILSDRLTTLLEHGLIAKTRVPARGQVHDYALTGKGRDLLPVLVALSAWGDRYAAGELGPPRLWWHTTCEHATEPTLTCSHCHAPIEPDSLRTLPGPGADHRQRAEGMLPVAA
jgi:DNA-binding HxlR family transcriptional regulator